MVLSDYCSFLYLYIGALVKDNSFFSLFLFLHFHRSFVHVALHNIERTPQRTNMGQMHHDDLIRYLTVATMAAIGLRDYGYGPFSLRATAR